ANLTSAAESDVQLRRDRAESATFAAKLAQVRAETEDARRELQRLRGLPRELSLLPGVQLQRLQEEISESLRRVQSELEQRSRCCSCGSREREVVLHPCMHLALC
ncbi:unnamed protein product, partial [Polarella glacialis]